MPLDGAAQIFTKLSQKNYAKLRFLLVRNCDGLFKLAESETKLGCIDVTFHWVLPSAFPFIWDSPEKVTVGSGYNL